MSVEQNNSLPFDTSQKYFKAPYTSPKTRQLGANKKLTHEVDYLRDQIEEMAGLTIKNKLRIGELEAANYNMNIFIQENYKKHSTEKLRMMVRREMKAKLTLQSELIEIEKKNENLASANFELNETINGMKTKLMKRHVVVESDPNTQLLKDTIVNLKAGFSIREKSLLQQINKQQDVICYLRNCITSNGDTLRKVTEGVCTQLVAVEDLLDTDIREQVDSVIDGRGMEEYLDLDDDASGKDTNPMQLQAGSSSPTSTSTSTTSREALPTTNSNLVIKELENKVKDYQEMVELLEAECLHYRQSELKIQQDYLILNEMFENSKKSHVNELQNKITEVLRQNSMAFLDVEIEEASDKDNDLELQFESFREVLQNDSPADSTIAITTTTDNIILDGSIGSSNDNNDNNDMRNNSNSTNNNTWSPEVAAAVADKTTKVDDKDNGLDNNNNDNSNMNNNNNINNSNIDSNNGIECRQDSTSNKFCINNLVNQELTIEVTDATDNFTADNFTTAAPNASDDIAATDDKTNNHVSNDNNDNQNSYTTNDVLALLNDLEALQQQYIALENEKNELSACLSEADEIILELKQLHESISEENKQMQLNEKRLIHKIDEQDKEILGLKIKLRMTFSWTNANYDPLSPSNNKVNSSSVNGNGNDRSTSRDTSESKSESINGVGGGGGGIFSSSLLNSDHKHYFVISDDEEEEEATLVENNDDSDYYRKETAETVPTTTSTTAATSATNRINAYNLNPHHDRPDVTLPPLTTGNTISPPFLSLHTSELNEADRHLDTPAITTISTGKNSSSSRSSLHITETSEIDSRSSNNNHTCITDFNYTRNANQILLLEEMIELLETDIQSCKQKELYLLQENDALKDVIEDYNNKWNAMNTSATVSPDCISISKGATPSSPDRPTVNTETQTELATDSMYYNSTNSSANNYYNNNNSDTLNLIKNDNPKNNSELENYIINNSNNIEEDNHDNNNSNTDDNDNDNDSDTSSILIVFEGDDSPGDISSTGSLSSPQYHTRHGVDYAQLPPHPAASGDTESCRGLPHLPPQCLPATETARSTLPDNVSELEIDWKDFTELQLLLNHSEKAVDRTSRTSDTASTTTNNDNCNSSSSNSSAARDPTHPVSVTGPEPPPSLGISLAATTTTPPPPLPPATTPDLDPSPQESHPYTCTINELQSDLKQTSASLSLALQELRELREQSLQLETDNSSLKYELDLRNIRIKFLEDVVEELNTDLSDLQKKVLDYEMIQKEIGIKIVR